MKNICVFCSSSNALDETYFTAAAELAKEMSQHSMDLVYGGSNVGLMKEVADQMMQAGRKAIGVIPQRIYDKGLGFEAIDELIVTPDMASRKTKMGELSDAFIALPGGFGTLEEIMEVITLKQLQYHNKPIVFIDTNGFYQELFSFFEKMYSEKFAKPDYKDYYFLAANPQEAVDYLLNYQAPDFKDKWYWVGSDQFDSKKD